MKKLTFFTAHTVKTLKKKVVKRKFENTVKKTTLLPKMRVFYNFEK